MHPSAKARLLAKAEKNPELQKAIALRILLWRLYSENPHQRAVRRKKRHEAKLGFSLDWDSYKR